jgi:hypothetical protein
MPAEPFVVRPASTILLLRDGAVTGGIEVFMMVRHYEIDFASGALVFTGGQRRCDRSGHRRSARALCRQRRPRRGDTEFPHRRDSRDV